MTGGLTLLADTNLTVTGSLGTTGALALQTTFGDISLTAPNMGHRRGPG